MWDIHSAYGLMPPHNEIGKEVGWVKPNYGWVALNVNGSVMEANQAAGVGALCQDHVGDVFWGFIGNIKYMDILCVEIQALLQGIKLCWEKGFRKVIYLFRFINIGLHGE